MRSRRTTREDGTVLLSTLLVLSLMSAVALGLLATLRLSIGKAQTLGELSQADLYTRGAQDFAAAQIGRLSTLEGPMLNAQLVVSSPIVLPYDGGSITAVVRDGTHCLRLSGLTDRQGTVQDGELIRLRSLLIHLGVGLGEAESLSDSIADWVDADSQRRPGGAEDGVYLLRPETARSTPHRTANVPLSSVAELRAVDGMTEDLFRALRPHVCLGAVGAGTAFNIDTALPRHAPVLAALIGPEPGNLDLALNLIEQRPATGFGSTEALEALLPEAVGDDEPSGLDRSAVVFAPDRITVEALVNFGEAERARVFAFEDIGSPQPRLAHRDWGRDAFLPAAVQTPSDVGSGRVGEQP